MKEGIACYQDYLRALLDLTDNRVGDRIVPPPQVRRHDPDDPYLVVAADKGTATFSDYANAISREYGFWLGDAFASGGSAGYDHKAMGITARGAWESVKRHFREMGVDTQTTDFTVAGIGDMSGDVFGNGMLLSPHIRLVAAFDHRHIFLDPNPDPAIVASPSASGCSGCRARRGPTTTRSSSPPGGGVHPRSAKSIAITAGGQGGARDHRRHADADRARQRDPEGAGRPPLQRRHRHLRQGDGARRTRRSATARTTRCASTAASCAARCVVEGGNLGCTQLGRIEYALAGGRIYTDAIDNSGGRRHVGSRGEHQDPARPRRSPTASSPRSSATRCSRR